MNKEAALVIFSTQSPCGLFRKNVWQKGCLELWLFIDGGKIDSQLGINRLNVRLVIDFLSDHCRKYGEQKDLDTARDRRKLNTLEKIFF